jgi:hypothetical protein
LTFIGSYNNYMNVLSMFLTVEVIMPKKIDWTASQDMKIKRMRAENASWDSIAIAVGVTRWTVIERGRRLGARLPPPDFEPRQEDPDRPALPPGHSETWGIINVGSSLEGMPYPIPTPVR